MKQEKEEEKSVLDINTPLECIGFGFLIMLLGGGFFTLLLHEDFEGFTQIIWGVYAIASGPHILVGIIGIISGLGFMNEFLKHIPKGAVVLSHYVAVLARDKFDSKYCILIFFGVLIVSTIIYLIYKKKKENNNK